LIIKWNLCNIKSTLSEASTELSNQLRDLRACIHLTFHWYEDLRSIRLNFQRLGYLRQTLIEIRNYQFSTTVLVIHTNVDWTRQVLWVLAPWVEVRIHRNLDDPLMLSWAHRREMERSIVDRKADVFMYLEDDLAIPWVVIKSWYTDNILLKRTGHDLRGFLRFELAGQKKYLSDIREPCAPDKLVEIDGHFFLRPSNPYCAFWIYTLDQMEEFITMRCWQEFHYPGTPRESAAIGMGFYEFQESSHPRNLVPMATDGSISSACLVHHLPNNYAEHYCDEPGALGSLLVDDILQAPHRPSDPCYPNLRDY